VTGQSLLDRYETSLRGLACKSRLRMLNCRSGFDFASNDYLARAGDKRIADALATALARPREGTGTRGGAHFFCAS
jgi:8-amino-7-oxononanoate synthase